MVWIEGGGDMWVTSGKIENWSESLPAVLSYDVTE